MENKKTISEILGVSMESIKEMADVNAIIGDPITTPDGTTIIPVSKVNYGFASGGSDIPSKYDKELFGGGAGAGFSIKPQGFLSVSSSGEVKMIPMESESDPISSAMSAIPGLIEKIKGIINKGKGDAEEEAPAEGEVTISD